MSPKRERDPETGLPIISTPNGKRWAWDTIGKAVAAVLAVLALAIWGRFLAIYGLPPRVDAAEKSISELQVAVTKRAPMSEEEVRQLAAAIVAALPEPSPAPRKGR